MIVAVMVMAVILGSITSWIFILILLFVMTDIDGVIAGAGGPLLTIYFQATSNKEGAVCLLIFNVVAMCACFPLNRCLVSSWLALQGVCHARSDDNRQPGLPVFRERSRLCASEPVPCPGQSNAQGPH